MNNEVLLKEEVWAYFLYFDILDRCAKCAHITCALTPRWQMSHSLITCHVLSRVPAGVDVSVSRTAVCSTLERNCGGVHRSGKRGPITRQPKVLYVNVFVQNGLMLQKSRCQNSSPILSESPAYRTRLLWLKCCWSWDGESVLSGMDLWREHRGIRQLEHYSAGGDTINGKL